MARIVLWSSAVRVHDSHAYRKKDTTRECISCMLMLDVFLSVHEKTEEDWLWCNHNGRGVMLGRSVVDAWSARASVCEYFFPQAGKS